MDLEQAADLTLDMSGSSLALEESIGDKLETEAQKNNAIRFDDDGSARAMALKMILTSRGFVLKKDIEGGPNEWIKSGLA